MADEFQELRRQIDAINARNARKEAEKSWETSVTRLLILSVVTYVTTACIFWFINVEQALMSALVPTVAFFLSTLSLPYLRESWVRHRLKRTEQER